MRHYTVSLYGLERDHCHDGGSQTIEISIYCFQFLEIINFVLLVKLCSTVILASNYQFIGQTLY